MKVSSIEQLIAVVGSLAIFLSGLIAYLAPLTNPRGSESERLWFILSRTSGVLQLVSAGIHVLVIFGLIRPDGHLLLRIVAMIASAIYGFFCLTTFLWLADMGIVYWHFDNSGGIYALAAFFVGGSLLVSGKYYVQFRKRRPA